MRRLISGAGTRWRSLPSRLFTCHPRPAGRARCPEHSIESQCRARSVVTRVSRVSRRAARAMFAALVFDHAALFAHEMRPAHLVAPGLAEGFELSQIRGCVAHHDER